MVCSFARTYLDVHITHANSLLQHIDETCKQFFFSFCTFLYLWTTTYDGILVALGAFGNMNKKINEMLEMQLAQLLFWFSTKTLFYFWNWYISKEKQNTEIGFFVCDAPDSIFGIIIRFIRVWFERWGRGRAESSWTLIKTMNLFK